jgi:hypothetical protein
MFAWFFPLSRQNIMWKNISWKELKSRIQMKNQTLEPNIFMNCKGKWFFITKNTRPSKKNIMLHIIFFERVFQIKKFDMDEPNILFFSHVVYPNFLSLKSWFFLNFLWKLLNELQYVFLNMLFHLFYNKILNP